MDEGLKGLSLAELRSENKVHQHPKGAGLILAQTNTAVKSKVKNTIQWDE